MSDGAIAGRARQLDGFSALRPGATIVFICCRCASGRLTLPAANHLTIASAFERARDLRWAFEPDAETADGAVVCPACRPRNAAETMR